MKSTRRWWLVSVLPMACMLMAFGGLDTWAVSHPDAARDLGTWAKADPAGAKKVFELDAQHPDQTKDFVHWAADKNETVDQYAAAHKGQPMATLISEHHATVDGLTAWTRKHKDAAKKLVDTPKGLSDVGKNFVK